MSGFDLQVAFFVTLALLIAIAIKVGVAQSILNFLFFLIVGIYVWHGVFVR